jgi:hypothetical protein
MGLSTGQESHTTGKGDVLLYKMKVADRCPSVLKGVFSMHTLPRLSAPKVRVEQTNHSRKHASLLNPGRAAGVCGWVTTDAEGLVR